MNGLRNVCDSISPNVVTIYYLNEITRNESFVDCIIYDKDEMALKDGD